MAREYRPETVIIGSNGIRLRHHAQPLRFDNQGEVQARLLEVNVAKIILIKIDLLILHFQR